MGREEGKGRKKKGEGEEERSPRKLLKIMIFTKFSILWAPALTPSPIWAKYGN